MITYKTSKIASSEIVISMARDEDGELLPLNSYSRLVNFRYLGLDGSIALGDTYINFTEVPPEVIGQLDTALVALYECASHLQKLKQKRELTDGDLIVNGNVYTIPEPQQQQPE